MKKRTGRVEPKQVEGQCRYLKNGVCGIRAKQLSGKDGIYPECERCPKDTRKKS